MENLELKEEKKKSFASSKEWAKKRSKRRKRDDSNSSVVKSSEKFHIDYKPIAWKYFILYGKCKHTTNNYNELTAMTSNRKTEEDYVTCSEQERAKCSNEKKLKKLINNKNKEKIEKELQHFQKLQNF